MGTLSWWHWMIIIAAFVLLFGGKRLPDAARGLGRSLRILKSEVSAMHDESTPNQQPPQPTVQQQILPPAGVTQPVITPEQTAGQTSPPDTPPSPN